MNELKIASKIKNIGFISTRIAGTDGVSLEIEKWANIMESLGLKCFYFAGELDRPPDDYTSDVRQALGIGDDELFVLQPTRVVKRKGIEHAIELVYRLGMRAKLVISHASGDEGDDYEQRIREYSELMKVDTLFVSDIIDENRGLTKNGRKIYTLEDIYPHADLVTYPSTFEGFGNAFLEAVYFRKPVVVNLYSIYLKDIKPKGFLAVELDGYVTEAAVEKAKQILKNPELRLQMVDQNYKIAEHIFSYANLRRRIRSFLEEPLTVMQAIEYY